MTLDTLLKKLKVEEKPTFDHYINILTTIHTESNGQKLNPNELKLVNTVVKKIYKLEIPNTSTIVRITFISVNC